jgi:hypothetical protein
MYMWINEKKRGRKMFSEYCAFYKVVWICLMLNNTSLCNKTNETQSFFNLIMESDLINFKSCNWVYCYIRCKEMTRDTVVRENTLLKSIKSKRLHQKDFATLLKDWKLTWGHILYIEKNWAFNAAISFLLLLKLPI